jgi:hypothetical protein
MLARSSASRLFLCWPGDWLPDCFYVGQEIGFQTVFMLARRLAVQSAFRCWPGDRLSGLGSICGLPESLQANTMIQFEISQ